MDNNLEVAAARSQTTDIAAAPLDRATRASHLYDAECALHMARQTQADAWIAVAAEKLHQAIVDHLAAVVAGPATHAGLTTDLRRANMDSAAHAEGTPGYPDRIVNRQPG